MVWQQWRAALQLAGGEVADDTAHTTLVSNAAYTAVAAHGVGGWILVDGCSAVLAGGEIARNTAYTAVAINVVVGVAVVVWLQCSACWWQVGNQQHKQF